MSGGTRGRGLSTGSVGLTLGGLKGKEGGKGRQKGKIRVDNLRGFPYLDLSNAAMLLLLLERENTAMLKLRDAG